MPSQRPGSVTAAAVMAIIYGSLFTLCSICEVVGVAAQPIGGNFFAGAGGNPNQAQLQQQQLIERNVPGYRAVRAVTALLGLTLAIALLIAGIGLIGMRSWARMLALIVCFVAVASTLFQVVYQSALVLPAMNKAFQAAPAGAMPQGPGGPEMAQLMQTMFPAIAVVIVIWHFLWMIYLLIIVLLLRRRHVRAAFAAGGLPAEGEEPPFRDDEDEGWGRSRPRENPEDDRYR
jgi:hypothetical protein